MNERRFPRWAEPSSDASPELREALRELQGEDEDAARIRSLEVRFAGLFGADFGPAPPPATVAPTANGSPAATGASGVTLAAKVGLFVVLGVGTLSGASVLTMRRDVEALRASSRGAVSSIEYRPISIGNIALPAVPESSAAEPTGGERPPRGRVVAPARSDNVGAGASQLPGGSVSEEARLLRAARAASKTGSLDRALALLDEHEQRFPRGALGEERELFAIELLARAGKRAEANERLNGLRMRSANSPYVRIAERMLRRQ